ncbi:LD-carboxypeptidase [Ferruginibacter lapsinanis]|uniref:S66 peptidase family protein n=1 Tax=Ferruginibacter lapsinanis TaxID=563172 RepID=UPI001E414C9F|nr:LD-carboxypeptidase [Ferruginibacter lapsinanis]UEG50285.1 LD-carboxypeptidase [Ferruginibacter lapsinanis]
MERKSFLSSIIPLGAVLSGMVKGEETLTTDKVSKIPPYLKEGDVIGITSPAGYITLEDVQPAVKKLEEWGYTVKIGNTIGKRDFTFGGTDEERLEDLQEMLHDRDIKAVMCARGGYGLVRIIDKINFTEFKKYPKWIIGFSDVTVLHNHINRNFGIATIHSKMCNSFPDDWSKADESQIISIHSIRMCLTNEKIHYAFLPNPKNRLGNVKGELVGGNLRTIENLAGTKSDLITKNKILFVEDTGEYLYSIDRMFWNLQRTGKLSQLKGLIIGGFKTKPDDPGEEFGKSIEEIVLEKVKEYNYPVCFNFPVGHQKENFALKCGVFYNLDCTEFTCILTEI